MISMEFTSKYVHMLEGTSGGKGVAVKKAVSIPIPERSVRNGYIRNQEELSGMLMEALVENEFHSKEIAFTIDSTALKIKQADIPFVSRDRALQFVKRDFGSIVSDEEHLFDYTVQSTYKKGRLTQMKCTIYAIPRELLLEYSLLCKTLGLKLKRIDVLNDAITKQLELEYPNVNKEEKRERTQPQKKKKKSRKLKEESLVEDVFEVEDPTREFNMIKGPIRLWVGFYYEKLKLITNGINGQIFVKTVMTESLERNDEEENEDKELIALCVNEIKKFIQFQEEVSPDYPIEQIEVFGEHLLLNQICNVVSSFVKKSTIQLHCPRQVKGISDGEYARYVGGIGNLVRR